MSNESVLKMLREHSKNSNYHPLSALLDLTQEADATIGDQITVHKTIAKYVEAENKAIEFSGKVTSGVQFNFDMVKNAG